MKTEEMMKSNSFDYAYYTHYTCNNGYTMQRYQKELRENFSLLSFVTHKVSKPLCSMVSGSVASRKFTKIYLE